MPQAGPHFESKSPTGPNITVSLRVNLGRWIPDRTPLDLPVFCALSDQSGLVTIPFAVYGQEAANRIKPAFFVDRSGQVSRRIIAGLTPEATIVTSDARGLLVAWADSNQRRLVAVDAASGRTVWHHQLTSRGCVRLDDSGHLAVCSVAGQLRRVDGSGSLTSDLDQVFAAQPFSGAHGIAPHRHQLFLADPDRSHSVWEVDAMGRVVRRIGSVDDTLNRTARGLLSYPFDVLATPDGRLWVAEHGRRRLSLLELPDRLTLSLTAKSLDVDVLCTTRIFPGPSSGQVAVFARRRREIWLLVIDTPPSLPVV